jgi:hypothetical protein
MKDDMAERRWTRADVLTVMEFVGLPRWQRDKVEDCMVGLERVLKSPESQPQHRRPLTAPLVKRRKAPSP